MSPEFQDDLVFRVDFNSIDDDGRVKGSLYHGLSRRIPRIRERVFLQDGEGNRSWAWVADIRGVVLYFELDGTTWVSGENTVVQGAQTTPSHSWSAAGA
jgi:hypothetical protein